MVRLVIKSSSSSDWIGYVEFFVTYNASKPPVEVVSPVACISVSCKILMVKDLNGVLVACVMR